MDYETFIQFFNTMAKEERLAIGDYTLEYIKSPGVFLGQEETIYYSKGKYMLGTDSIREFYKPGSIMPTQDTSYEKSGIKNFSKLIDYLDYLYNTNIDRLKEEERQREQRIDEYLKEEERKQKKVDDFINPI